MLTLIFDEAATRFGDVYHPERPARLIRAEAYLLDKRPEWIWLKPRLATEEEVLRVHRPNHLERLRRPIDFDADTPYYPGIEEHARRAAGAAIGFCYLNSIAIAAYYALATGCERVGIWDFDAHHGNGTEEIVFGYNRIRFASIHQYPGYPGSGMMSRGNVFNWPIEPQSNAGQHASAVQRALDALVEFNPDL